MKCRYGFTAEPKDQGLPETCFIEFEIRMDTTLPTEVKDKVFFEQF